MSSEQLIGTKRVCDKLCIGRTRLYRIINGEDEQFPRPFPSPVVKGHTNIYCENEVDDYIRLIKSTREA